MPGDNLTNLMDSRNVRGELHQAFRSGCRLRKPELILQQTILDYRVKMTQERAKQAIDQRCPLGVGTRQPRPRPEQLHYRGC